MRKKQVQLAKQGQKSAKKKGIFKKNPRFLLFQRIHGMPIFKFYPYYPSNTSNTSIKQNPTKSAYVAPCSSPCACVSGIISSLIT